MFQNNRRGAAARRAARLKAVRLLRRDHRRRLAGAGRALHQRLGRPGTAVHLVALAHAGRAHQSLGPHLPAQRPLRLQAAHARRTRLRLADELRGPRALLRQGRDAHRRVWRQRRPREHAEFATWRAAAAAQAARQRPAGQAARAKARHPGGRRPSRRAHPALDHARLPKLLHPGNAPRAGDPGGRHAEARRVFLGHALRPRLLHPGQLPVDHRAPAAGAGHRQPRHRHRRHGARGHPAQGRRREAWSTSTARPGPNIA